MTWNDEVLLVHSQKVRRRWRLHISLLLNQDDLVLGGGFTCFSPIPGEMIQFDSHFFKWWVEIHQLDSYDLGQRVD